MTDLFKSKKQHSAIGGEMRFQKIFARNRGSSITVKRENVLTSSASFRLKILDSSSGDQIFIS